MKIPNKAPNKETVWAKVSDGEKFFWTLAQKDGQDWIGMHTWNEHKSDNVFSDYGWEVVGWKNLEKPN